METRAKADRTLTGVNTHLTHGSGIVVVGGDDHIDVLYNALKIENFSRFLILTFDLQVQKWSIINLIT